MHFLLFLSLVYILNCYYSSVSLTDLYFPLTHLSQERNLYLVLLFFFKKRRLLYIYFSHLFSPLQKYTTFYLYYIANVNSMYKYHFLFNSSSNSSTCCNVSPFINEKSVVSSTPTWHSLFFIFVNYHKITNINLLFNNNI